MTNFSVFQEETYGEIKELPNKVSIPSRMSVFIPGTDRQVLSI